MELETVDLIRVNRVVKNFLESNGLSKLGVRTWGAGSKEISRSNVFDNQLR